MKKKQQQQQLQRQYKKNNQSNLMWNHTKFDNKLLIFILLKFIFAR